MHNQFCPYLRGLWLQKDADIDKTLQFVVPEWQFVAWSNCKHAFEHADTEGLHRLFDPGLFANKFIHLACISCPYEEKAEEPWRSWAKIHLRVDQQNGQESSVRGMLLRIKISEKATYWGVICKKIEIEIMGWLILNYGQIILKYLEVNQFLGFKLEVELVRSHRLNGTFRLDFEILHALTFFFYNLSITSPHIRSRSLAMCR